MHLVLKPISISIISISHRDSSMMITIFLSDSLLFSSIFLLISFTNRISPGKQGEKAGVIGRIIRFAGDEFYAFIWLAMCMASFLR